MASEDAAAPARALGRLLGRRGRQQELHHVVERQRRRPRRRADETGDAGRVAHRAPRLVVELHADQDVAGQHLAVDLLALAVLDLGDLFGGHLDLEDVVADVEVLHAGLEVGLHLVLVAGVGVDDVPVAGPQRADPSSARPPGPRPRPPRPPRRLRRRFGGRHLRAASSAGAASCDGLGGRAVLQMLGGLVCDHGRRVRCFGERVGHSRRRIALEGSHLSVLSQYFVPCPSGVGSVSRTPT